MQNNTLPSVKGKLDSRELPVFCDKYNKFHAPPEFQRPEAWGKNERKEYLESLLLNRVEGTFTFVDIERCIDRLEKAGMVGTEDHNFLIGEQREGHEYIVLDGNNRLLFMNQLINNEWDFPVGKYYYISDDVDGSLDSFTVRRGKQNFNNLPPRVQKALNNRLCYSSEYMQITGQGMSDVFCNLNKQVAVNAQEFRNAKWVPWADYVREIRSKIGKTLLTRMFKQYITRLRGDEFIVDCLDLVLNAITIDENGEFSYSSINQSSKDNLYLSSWDDFDNEYYFDKFVDLMDYVEKMFQEGILHTNGKLVRTSLIRNIYWMMCNGLETYEEVAIALKCHEEYEDSDEVYESASPLKDPQTFKDACRGTGPDNIEICHMIFQKIITEVEQTLLNDEARRLEGLFTQ